MTRFALHDVTSISVRFDEINETRWMEFVFVDQHGGRHEVTAFVDKPLPIEGADFINHMASGDGA